MTPRIHARSDAEALMGKEDSQKLKQVALSLRFVDLPICRRTRKVQVALECEDLYKRSQMLAHYLPRRSLTPVLVQSTHFVDVTCQSICAVQRHVIGYQKDHVEELASLQNVVDFANVSAQRSTAWQYDTAYQRGRRVRASN